MKKYKGLPDKPEYEEIHFRSYKILKAGLVLNLIKAGLKSEEERKNVG